MKSHKLDKNTYFLRLDKGEEVITSINKFCQDQKIKCGTFHGIGATNNLQIGFLDPKTKKYKVNTFTKSLEISSLLGNITIKDNEVYLHCHINAGDEKCNVYGGHLVKAIISVTCEIFITTYSTKLIRKFNKEIGINQVN